MKLKKVTKTDISYPSRKNIKPILLSVGVAMAISGCGSNSVVIQKNSATNLSHNSATKEVSSYKKPTNNKKVEVKEPQNLGGVPPLSPKE